MPSLQDLAIDLINEAKAAASASPKLFALEQVKEIVFHRDTSIRSEIAPDVVNSFMIEKTASIRKFLISFVSEWQLSDFSAATPVALSMYSFFLASDSNDSIIRLVSSEITKMYDKAIMHISNMPPQVKTKSGPQGADPKAVWGTFRSIATRLIDMISSDRTESLRTQSLRLAEKMTLFGLPAEKLSLDPRLARSRQATGDSGTGPNSTEIPLHHQFINKVELEQEAESLFSKMLLWSSKKGPQGHPFTAAQMSQLGSCIANIASVRPKKSTNAATALAVLLSAKDNLCHVMTPQERDSLARNTQKLLRAVYASSDAEVMGKLRVALDSLVALGLDSSASATGAASDLSGDSVTGKRSAGAGGDDDDDNTAIEGGSGQTTAALRASAIAAVDAAENNIKLKAPKGADGSAGSQSASAASHASDLLASGAAAGASTAQSAGGATADTELSSDLMGFSDPSSAAGLKLVNIQAAPSVSGSSGASGIAMKPLGVSADSYADIATFALQKVLERMEDIKGFHPKASAVHAKLSIRTVLAMSLVDVAEDRPSARVLVIASVSSAASTELIESVPGDVNIPRPLWLFLSHILASARSSKTNKNNEGFSSDQLALLRGTLVELYNRIGNAGGDDYANQQSSSNPCKAMYDAACLAILSRTLQSSQLRHAAKDVLTSLPSVPASTLGLLKLLMHTGTRHKGTRAEALSLLGQLVFSEDKEAAKSSLYHLLWCALADEFEIRSKAINLLVSEVMPMEDWAWELVSLFSIQSALVLIGAEVVTTRLATFDEFLSTLPSEQQSKAAAAAGATADDVAKPEEEEASAETETAASGTEAMDVQEEGGGEAAAGEIEAAVVNQENGEEDSGHENDELAGGDSKEEGERHEQEEQEQESSQEESFNPTAALWDAVEKFDFGHLFKGSFPSCPHSPPAKVEAHVRKALHLLSQEISLADPNLLITLFGLYAAATAAAIEDGDKSVLVPLTAAADEKIASDNQEASTNEDSAAATAVKAIAGAAPPTVIPESKWAVIRRVIRSELDDIVPAASLHCDKVDLFGKLSSCDPLSRPLLERTLDLLHADYHMPASVQMVAKVRAFVASPIFELCEQDAATAAIASAVGGNPGNYSDLNAKIRVLSPLLGGFSSSEIMELLPSLLKTYADRPDAMKSVFRRIYSARPPPLSKAELLASLHRVDYEAHGLKQKVVVDSIGICLANKDDFRSEAVRDALADLIKDEVPAQALMRTAILAVQSHGNDMKKFVLNDVIPGLIRKRVWSTVPKLWDGVAHCVKKMASHKNAEPTLRGLLGLPGAQLKSILKVAPEAKAPMAVVLKALSKEEKEEVLSGKWAGIADTPVENSATAASADAAGGAPVEGAVVFVMDADKAKIVKELIALK